jgi:hypothetical protein
MWCRATFPFPHTFGPPLSVNFLSGSSTVRVSDDAVLYCTHYAPEDHFTWRYHLTTAGEKGLSFRQKDVRVSGQRRKSQMDIGISEQKAARHRSGTARGIKFIKALRRCVVQAVRLIHVLCFVRP